ncbi:MAG: hypothetical protein HY903_01510 [Deltaproteobacteria bacterium]|nr:hypothetical protein [Deltaproteobacteria bacterium]
MTRYLEGGWYSRKNRPRLKREVVDAAIDVAGMLHRAGVSAHRVMRIALKVRSLVIIANPLVSGTQSFPPRDRRQLAERLGAFSDDYPELQSFVNDCLDRVADANDMTAFYLHLVHIARMMQLLAHAAGYPGLFGGAPKTEHSNRAAVALEALSPAKPRVAARRKKNKKKVAAGRKLLRR